VKAIFQRSSLGWIGLAWSLMVGGMVSAQTVENSPQPSGSSSTLQTYLQERQTLAQQWRALVAQGASQQQLQAWRQQNAAQFQAQRQLAQTLALASALQPMRVQAFVNIPPNASSTLTDFLTTQANLASARAQIHNQLLQQLPPSATQAQVNAMQQQVAQLMQQQYAGEFQLQAQRAQALAAAAPVPLRLVGPVHIPPDASPQLQAYLTARNAIATSRAQTWNQYATADPAMRQTAMQQWRQQNAAALQQLSQQVQSLSNPTPLQEGTSQ